ncbi:hypothetical protein PsYK624_150510 [Phanerochaete sordida]|uniref:Uncharacterized protein n=1 Tax=Phanerochaete sordida TaxID=48140 RepID=A0A9P3LLL1_9APHY|nr:hypothetical protein PsYK624_150510 [Phanerochaete sordida]
MLFTQLISAATLAALAQTGLTSATPVESRDVYSPPVLYPHTGTVWYSGQRHNVTWDNSNPPKSISNRAFILLRWGNLGTPVVLAHDFDLRAGRVEVTVPDVITGNFSVVLFGDSGNWSEDFVINGPVTL